MRKNNDFQAGSEKDNSFSDALSSALGIDKVKDSTFFSIDDCLEKSVSGLVEIYFEKKGRNGKIATLVDFNKIDGGDLFSMAKSLKKLCGVGGSLNGSVLLLQGDVRNKSEAFLSDLGLKTKRIGG